MSTVHVRHIKSHLEKTFRGLVDMTDYAGQSKEQQENAFLSRSQAAFSLVIATGVEPSVAANCVTDAFDDNGIDAIYYDPDEKVLHVSQSKWHKSGTGSIDSGDIMKLAQGVRDLLDGKFHRFNSKVRGLQSLVSAALDDTATRFRILLVHTGLQQLSKHAMRPLEDLLNDVNDASDILAYSTFTQSDLHKAVASEAEGTSIKLEIMLHEWGHCKSPYDSYYGQIDASDVGQWWLDYQQSLFVKNLRKFTGSTEVNDAIQHTLRAHPQLFWYYNNGITMLCTSLRKKPIGGSRRTSGVFVCEGASIVNGAQTVGCVGAIAASNPEQLASVRVAVRLISLAKCPASFSIDITRAANTQNRIERRDFAALDPEQDRLRRDLSLELGKIYIYKSGDTLGNPEDGCTIEESTVALACSAEDVALAVQAKREIGKLWEDISKSPYKLLFNSSLTALRMWRIVDIYRQIEQVLKRQQAAIQDRERQIVVHGNRFIAHHVYRQLDLRQLDESAFGMAQLLASLSAITLKCSETITSQVQAMFPKAYPNSLFKNASKCKQLSETCYRLLGQSESK